MSIGVLVVDDSAVSRAVLSATLLARPEFRVMGHATNGREALEKIQSLSPDLVTMDLRMPIMNGLDTIEAVMATHPVPIVVVSGVSDAATALECVERGALEVVAKEALESSDLDALAERLMLLARVRVIRHVRRSQKGRSPSLSPSSPGRAVRGEAHWLAPLRTRSCSSGGSAPARPPAPSVEPPIVALAASTGGPRALAQVLRSLPPVCDAAILVIQHIPEGFDTGLAQWLSSVSPHPVAIAKPGEIPPRGAVRLAPAGHHLTLDSGGRLQLDQTPRIQGLRPAAERLFASLSEHHAERTFAVVLSGLGADGAKALRRLRDLGAQTAVQDRESATVWGMPKAALEAGGAASGSSLEEIAGAIGAWRGGHP